MTLAKRIIPMILFRGSSMVKGVRFESWRSVGHANQAANIHQARGVDELIALDIAATPEGRGPDFARVAELTRKCFMPITVGGGVKTVEDVDGLLRAGADKVACGSMSWTEMRRASDKFGAQAIVGIANHRSDDDPYAIAAWPPWGCGELILNSIDRDGTMEGYDLDVIHEVTRLVDVPVIAAGGCGTPQHALEAIQAGADAVAIGSMFLFTSHTPASVAQYLAENGVEIRLAA